MKSKPLDSACMIHLPMLKKSSVRESLAPPQILHSWRGGWLHPASLTVPKQMTFVIFSRLQL